MTVLFERGLVGLGLDDAVRVATAEGDPSSLDTARLIV